MAKLAKNPDNIDNVVIGANYEISKTVNGQTAKIEGHANLNAFNIDPDTFISYDQITEENVIEWVKQSIGDRLASIEIYLDEQNPVHCSKFSINWNTSADICFT